MSILGGQLIPPEITSEIFIWCLPSTIHATTYDQTFCIPLIGVSKTLDISIPLSLSSVCKLWRAIAHSTPELWTSFKIYIPSSDFPEHIQYARQWLLRSGQLPLSIQICTDPSESLKWQRTLVVELIDLLNRHSHRWESFDISVHPDLLPPGLFSKSTTILKAVSVFADWSPSPFHPFYVWLLSIQCHNITCFTGRYVGVGQALEILRLFPNIREYSLILLTSCYDNIPLPISPLTLTHLETLLVDIMDPMILDDLLPNIDAPSLKNFNYHGRDFSISCDTIITFLNRSGCLLNVFSLRYTSIDEMDIILLLVAMPSLETLILGPLSMDGITSVCRYHESITNRMLDILSDTADLLLHPHYGTFLPNLKSLEYIGFVLFSWEKIPLIFGEGRTKQHSSDSPATNRRPFDHLKLELYTPHLGHDPAIENISSELDRLCAEGYSIQISTNTKHRGKITRIKYYRSGLFNY